MQARSTFANYAQPQHADVAAMLVRTTNSLWLAISYLHSAFFFWTCIWSKKIL